MVPAARTAKTKRATKRIKRKRRPTPSGRPAKRSRTRAPVQQDLCHHGEAQGGVLHHPAAQRPVGGQSQPHRGSGPPNVGELEKSSLEFRSRARECQNEFIFVDPSSKSKRDYQSYLPKKRITYLY